MAAHAGKKFWQCRLRDYVPLKIWGLRRLSPQPVGMMDFGAASLSAFQPARCQCAHRQLRSAARSCDDFKARWSSVVFDQAAAWPCPRDIKFLANCRQKNDPERSKRLVLKMFEDCFWREDVDNC